MMSAAATPRVLARFTGYEAWLDALRAWVAENRIPHRTIDDIAGYADRYTQKILGTTPVKKIGPESMRPLLTALGLELWLVVDEQQLARLQKRHDFKLSDWPEKRTARGVLRAADRPKKRAQNPFRGNSEWGRVMQARWQLKTTAKFRNRSASKAARAKRRKLRRKLLTEAMKVTKHKGT